MRVYTYSQARQHLASVLDQAQETGKVLIRRKDGSTFALVPELPNQSPMDVPAIQTDITADEVVSSIREGRRHGAVRKTNRK